MADPIAPNYRVLPCISVTQYLNSAQRGKEYEALKEGLYKGRAWLRLAEPWLRELARVPGSDSFKRLAEGKEEYWHFCWEKDLVRGCGKGPGY